MSIVNQPTQVIKLGVIYDSPVRQLSHYAIVQQALDYVMHAKPQEYVRVYQHGYLGTYTHRHQELLLYYYVMERLTKLTEDEHKVFHSILSHEDRGIRKDYPVLKIREMLRGMSAGLDFDPERVIFFCQAVRRSPIQHLDISARNIMKGASGDYKLIDLDRVIMEDTSCRK